MKIFFSTTHRDPIYTVPNVFVHNWLAAHRILVRQVGTDKYRYKWHEKPAEKSCSQPLISLVICDTYSTHTPLGKQQTVSDSALLVMCWETTLTKLFVYCYSRPARKLNPMRAIIHINSGTQPRIVEALDMRDRHLVLLGRTRTEEIWPRSIQG